MPKTKIIAMKEGCNTPGSIEILLTNLSIDQLKYVLEFFETKSVEQYALLLQEGGNR